MAEALLCTRFSRYGPVPTLYASGELDIASGPVLEHAVLRALVGQGGEFHLDLGGLTFMDSSGAKALLSAQNRVESLGRRLVIVSPSGPVRRVLALMALDQVLDVRSPAEPASDIGRFFATTDQRGLTWHRDWSAMGRTRPCPGLVPPHRSAGCAFVSSAPRKAPPEESLIQPEDGCISPPARPSRAVESRSLLAMRQQRRAGRRGQTRRRRRLRRSTR